MRCDANGSMDEWTTKVGSSLKVKFEVCLVWIVVVIWFGSLWARGGCRRCMCCVFPSGLFRRIVRAVAVPLWYWEAVSSLVVARTSLSPPVSVTIPAIPWKIPIPPLLSISVPKDLGLSPVPLAPSRIPAHRPCSFPSRSRWSSYSSSRGSRSCCWCCCCRRFCCPF